jgi:uroporphyrinogen decarboxylase
MQPRQRLLAALRRQNPDRIPYDLKMTARARQRFVDETGISDVEGYLDLDYHYVKLPAPTSLPDFSAYFRGKVPDWPDIDWNAHSLPEFSPQQDYPHFFRVGERTCLNEWGEYRIFDADLSYHRKVHPLPDPTTPLAQALNFPFPDVFTESRFAGVDEQVANAHANGKAAVLFLEMTVFEKSWRVRGFDTFLVDMLANQELAEYLLSEVARRTAHIAARCARAGVDVIQFGDDVGAEHAMLMRPALWRKLLKPRLAEVIAAAKTANPEVIAFYHSDGHIRPIIAELIEVGVDVLNPIQPESVDVAELKRSFGSQLSFWGGIGVQSVLPFGTPEEVRDAVRSLIAQAGEGGGLVVSPSHLVEHDVPAANIIAFVDTMREFGPKESVQ